MVKAIELVAKQRSDLAAATGEFVQTIADLSACDIEKQLAHALAAMADVERQAQQLQTTQSSQDIVTLMSTGRRALFVTPYATDMSMTVDEYARLINSVRVSLTTYDICPVVP